MMKPLDSDEWIYERQARFCAYRYFGKIILELNLISVFTK
jgi:hypothetical protein